MTRGILQVEQTHSTTLFKVYHLVRLISAAFVVVLLGKDRVVPLLSQAKATRRLIGWTG
jgi:hypothetical protein